MIACIYIYSVSNRHVKSMQCIYFSDQIFRQYIGTHINTNFAHFYPTCFYNLMKQSLLQSFYINRNYFTVAFSSIFRYIDNVFSINNHDFHPYINPTHPNVLEIKDTTQLSTFASYLDIILNIASCIPQIKDKVNTTHIL